MLSYRQIHVRKTSFTAKRVKLQYEKISGQLFFFDVPSVKLLHTTSFLSRASCLEDSQTLGLCSLNLLQDLDGCRLHSVVFSPEAEH